METKALLFAYCPVCEGVNVVLDDYNTLSKLGCGEARQDCAFHSPVIKTVELMCQKCANKTAIARLPIIYEVAEIVSLIKTIEDNLNKLKDQAAGLTIDAGFDDYATSDNFLKRVREVAANIKEMNQLLGAIKHYRFSTDAPQTYCRRGIYKTAD